MRVANPPNPPNPPTLMQARLVAKAVKLVAKQVAKLATKNLMMMTTMPVMVAMSRLVTTVRVEMTTLFS